MICQHDRADERLLSLLGIADDHRLILLQKHPANGFAKPMETETSSPRSRLRSSDFIGGSTEGGSPLCGVQRCRALLGGWRVKSPPQVKGGSHCAVICGVAPNITACKKSLKKVEKSA